MRRLATLSACPSLVLAGSLLAGCSMDTTIEPRNYETRDISIVATLEAARPMRYSSGMVERERLVLRDEEAWAATWQKLAARYPSSQVPVIDFAEHAVVVVSMGRRSSGGYQIVIDDAEVTASRVTIFVTERSPGAGCITTQAITEPTFVALLPRFEVEATFVEKTVVHNCR
jgi:PrcB C-terminal